LRHGLWLKQAAALPGHKARKGPPPAGRARGLPLAVGSCLAQLWALHWAGACGDTRARRTPPAYRAARLRETQPRHAAADDPAAEKLSRFAPEPQTTSLRATHRALPASSWLPSR